MYWDRLQYYSMILSTNWTDESVSCSWFELTTKGLSSILLINDFHQLSASFTSFIKYFYVNRRTADTNCVVGYLIHKNSPSSIFLSLPWVSRNGTMKVDWFRWNTP